MSSHGMDRVVGRRIGPYAVHRRIGKGGMGCVYLAKDCTLERPVALKVMLPDLASEEALVRRFHREAKAAARLNHPNIVQVYGVGAEGGVQYIAMEYVRGHNLEQILCQQKRVPWLRALGIASQVAAALSCAHGKSIIHRDIKPSNILIDRENRVRVTDFGLAKVQTSSSKLTTHGMFMGTPNYMSPEQCGAAEVCPASDLFSLGVVLYEMLSGEQPFNAETPAGLVKQITLDEPRPLRELAPDVPSAVEALVTALLAKDAGTRIASGKELIERIAQVSNVSALSSPPAGLHPPQAEAATTPPPAPSPAPPVTPHRATPALYSTGAPPPPPPGRSPRRRWLIGAVMGLLAAVVLLAAVLTVAIARRRAERGRPASARADRTGGPAPARDDTLAPLSISLASAGDAEALGWVGSPPKLLTLVTGHKGDGRPGNVSFFLVDPVARRADLLRDVGPSGTPQRPVRRGPDALAPRFFAPSVAQGSFLHDKVLVLRPTIRERQGGGPVQELWALPVSDPAKHSVLMRLAIAGRAGARTNIPSGICRGLAVHPDGNKVCVILSRNPRENTAYLAELPVSDGGPGALGTPFVQSQVAIRSVAYSYDGNYVVYDAHSLAAGSVVYAVEPRLGTEANPEELFADTSGVMALACSPAEHRVVMTAGLSGASRVILLNASSSSVVAEELGEGRVSDSPWSPDGRWFAAVLRDPAGNELVVQYEAASRQYAALAGLPPAAAGHAAPWVSPDGRWAALPLRGRPVRVLMAETQQP